MPKIQVLIEIDVEESDEFGARALRERGLTYGENVISIGKPNDTYLQDALNSYKKKDEILECVRGILNTDEELVSINLHGKEVQW